MLLNNPKDSKALNQRSSTIGELYIQFVFADRQHSTYTELIMLNPVAFNDFVVISQHLRVFNDRCIP